MVVKIEIQPSGVTFPADESVTILDAALNNNINISYSCKNGSCGACKTKLVSGEVNYLKESCLSENEAAEGFILTCCTTAKSDITLNTDYHPELSGIKPKTFVSKVNELVIDSDSNVAIVKLRLPPNANLNYLSGQYIDLILNGQRRSYSIANAPTDFVELHIRKVEQGFFSQIIFNELKLQQLIRFEGPYGTFFVRNDKRPLIFLAGGTGFAPVKSMVEQLLKNDDKRPVHIYWGMPTGKHFYSNEPTIWAKQYPHIHFIPVVSENDPLWTGHTGLVHKAVLQEINDLSEFSVYACGSPAMISAAHQDFLPQGMKEEYFYSDAFIPSK